MTSSERRTSENGSSSRRSEGASPVGGRTPPHDLEAERAVLGSLLLAMGEAGQVFGRVTPESFYSRRHALIFEQVRGLHEEHGTVDVILLRDRLEREGVLDEVGGLDYLVDLTESVTTSANANHYANLLVDKALLRGLIQTTSEILTDAYDSGLEPGQQVDRAEQRVFELSNRSMEDGTVPLSEAIRSTFDLIDQWHKGGSGLKTGYTDLDKRTNGLQPAELIVVAGRPSMGKTTISMNIAQAIALGLKKSVGIFSLEVDSRAIAMNLLCGTARVPSQKLRGNELGAREWQRLTAAADMLSEAEIYIDDSPNLNTMSIRAKARRLKAQKDIELIVIDYLQLLEFGGGRTESRQQEISAISRSLKAMARELSVPVITISQLSRAVEQREDHRPRMSDLRESGAIEQDADKILLIYRDEYYHPDKEESKGKAEIIVAKNRNGPVGTVELAFIGEYMRFENLANYQEEF